MAAFTPFIPSVRCFKEAGPAVTPEVVEAPSGAVESRGDAAIACRACGEAVTARGHAIRVNGGHEHTFFNPAGVVYEIGCFALAPGCVESGSPTTDFSWFPGFAWRYSSCRGCRRHLGWRFVSGGDDAFHGLILSRLVDLEGGAGARA